MRALRIIGIVSLAATAAACLPIPHRSFLSALVHGQVWQGSGPLAHARLRLVAAPGPSPCEAEHFTEATTDAEGRFVLCPVPKRRWVMHLLPGHRIFTWNVCLQVADGPWQSIASGDQYTIGDLGPRMLSHLNCDVAGKLPCATQDNWDFDDRQLRDALSGRRCEGM